jgi:hypothetical protein
MKKLLFFGLSLMACQILFAQAPETAWMKTYGGSGTESSSQVVENTDGDYFFACSSTSPPSEERTAPKKGSRDMWVVKTDKEGNKIWDKAYGGGLITVTGMAATADGGFIVGANTQTSGTGIGSDKTDTTRGGIDVWLIKLDRDGNKVWDKTLGGSEDDFLGEIIISPDGSILVAINTSSPVSGDKTAPGFGGSDCWVVKLNSSGQIIWDKVFGGTGGDSFYTGLVDKEGNYIFGGTSFSPVSGTKTEPSRGGNDGWLLKTDANGNVIWDKTLGGDLTDYIQSMAETSDGDYVLGIVSNSNKTGDKTDEKRGGNDCWLVKVSQSGDILWQKTIGGSSSDGVMSVQTDKNDGIYLGCRSVSDISEDKECAFGGGIANDSWIIKTNSIGDIEWQSCYSFSSLDDAILSSEGDYVISGTKDGMRLIKLNSSTSTNIANFSFAESLMVYPNPTAHFLNIQFNKMAVVGISEIEIYNSQGSLLYQKLLNMVDGDNKIDIDFQNGVYFLKISMNGKIYTQTFVVFK